MSNTLDDNKSTLIAKATDLAANRKGTGGPPLEHVPAMLKAYYRHVAPEDVCDRSEVDLYGALASHWRLGLTRPQGTANVRVFTPTVQEHGWSANAHSVVEVVTDDMPFLVDSVTMALAEQQRNLHVIVHPHFDVVRSITGELQDIAVAEDGVAATGDAGSVRESWMHVEIDRIPEGDDIASIEAALQRVLRDVREAVEDWQRMHDKINEIVDDLSANPPPLPAEEVQQGRDLLTWLADDHFTFLGYREYQLEVVEGDDVLRAVPGTGFGILRSDPDLSAAFGRLPELVKAKAREKVLLVLAKANSRATVHRDAYLDYVGVKVFDEAGDVIGERRFLGLFSSAAYTESLTRIPLLREKAAQVMARVGFEPHSHAGKALMDTLENYPRDELFQTPVDQLSEIAEAVMYTRERRQLRLFVRRDTYGRYLSCLVYLPRDRYNTTVRERIAAILRDRLGGDSVEFTVRVSESNMARVHFVVRPPQGQTVREIDGAGLERELIEAARSWQDDFTAAW